MVVNNIKRLSYTFSKGNKPNQNDIEALNGVIDYVNKEKERELNNYHLFAKMYISVFKDTLIRSDGNYTLASKTIVDIVRIDLNNQLDRLVDEANQIFLLKDIKENDLDSEFNTTKYDKEKMKTKIIELISNIIEDYK